MVTRTQTYWINRSNQRMDRYILDAERQADLISQSYYQASRYIEEEMAKTIKNLAVLSDDRTAIAALKRSPSKSLLRQLRSAVNTMAPGPEKDKALTLLASPSYQLRLRQLQATIDNARRECERMYQMELNSTTEHLRNLYDDAFLHSVYDIDKGYNALHTFSMYPASRVDKLLKMPWSGAHYSDRIWGRTQNLADELRTQLITAFMTGATISETSAAIRERFAYASAYQARRLIRTETNYIANQAELDSYKRLGIEEYKYIATLDTRTSRLCQELDGQVFNSDDATAGKNFPPMHPNCRSTTIMYDAEEPLKERTARDKNGNRITVPGNMKYKEWLEKYHPELVDKAGESGIIKSKNMAAQGHILPDFSLYEINDNPDAVTDIILKISNDLGISTDNIDLSGIRNIDVLGPFISRMSRIRNDTGLSFKAIKSVDFIEGDKLCLASYKTFEDTLYISSTYFNSKDLIIDCMKEWSNNNIFTKQARSIAYLAEHEAAHIRIHDKLLTSSEAIDIWRKRKEKCKNSFNIDEFYADCVAIYRTNPNTKSVDVLKVIEFLKEKDVKV